MGRAPTRRERFIRSKCDRCGKTTPARQNGIGDLFVLGDEAHEEIQGEGNFCLSCINQYSPIQWLVWIDIRRNPQGDKHG